MKKLFILILLVSCSKPNVGKIESCPKVTFNEPKLTTAYNECCNKDSGKACNTLATSLDKAKYQVQPYLKRSCQTDWTVEACKKTINPSLAPKDNLNAIDLTCRAKLKRPENKLTQIVACATHSHLTNNSKEFQENFKYLNDQYLSAKGEVKKIWEEGLLQVNLLQGDNDKALELLKSKFSGMPNSVNAIWKWSANSDYATKKFKETVEFRELLLHFQNQNK